MKCEFGLCAFEDTGACNVVKTCGECVYGKLVLMGISMKAIRTDKSSQACPICKKNVNGKYCSNCGQKLNY